MGVHSNLQRGISSAGAMQKHSFLLKFNENINFLRKNLKY